jgi:hypothetical protein
MDCLSAGANTHPPALLLNHRGISLALMSHAVPGCPKSNHHSNRGEHCTQRLGQFTESASRNRR